MFTYLTHLFKWEMRYVEPHNHLATGQFATQNDVPGAIEPDEVEVVLADVDADRRHLVCRFAGHRTQNLRMRPGARSVDPITGRRAR